MAEKCLIEPVLISSCFVSQRKGFSLSLDVPEDQRCDESKIRWRNSTFPEDMLTSATLQWCKINMEKVAGE